MKKKKLKKTKYVAMKVTEREYRLLKNIASLRRITVSTLLRLCIQKTRPDWVS